MKKIHTENQERKKAGYKNEKSIYAFSNGIYNGGVGRLWKWKITSNNPTNWVVATPDSTTETQQNEETVTNEAIEGNV